jgi:hypothetical protein
MISDTITVPNNAVLVGENWAQLVAFGEKFGDAQYVPDAALSQVAP